jgi:D-3-phosphoglycerate dehydrogenase / 2-oxoglutarate reductase
VPSAARAIVITTASARPQLERFSDLAAEGAEISERYDVGETRDADLLAAAIAGAWAVVAGSELYSAEVFARTRSLRAIVRFGAGYDMIDLEAATRSAVAVCVTPGANAEAVADMALALILACVRSVPALDAVVRRGGWRPTEPTRDLAGSTVAIVGLGAIGKAVARRLHGFGCVLLAVDPQPDRRLCAELRIELLDLDTALRRADVVTLHAPSLDATRRLLGERELSLMRPHAIVVNTARGTLIDEPALVAALRDGRIGGAGLDVFEQEPLPAGHALIGLPNVVLTTHASAFTRLAVERTTDAVIESLRTLLAGRIPHGCLNPVAWNDG